MCMTCGCGEVNNDHGDPRNITMNDLRDAARAGNESVKQACDNLSKSLQDNQPQGVS